MRQGVGSVQLPFTVCRPMRHILLRLMPVISALVLSALASPATAQTGTLEGRVADAETGAALSGVQISLEGPGLGALSGSGGTFAIRGVPGGPHTISARLIGYRTVRRAIRVRHGQNTRVEFELTRQAAVLSGITVVGTEAAPALRAHRSSSATRVDVPLIETPATVSVLTRDFLDRAGALKLEEAIQYVPGAGVENPGNPVTPKFNLRGFSVNLLTSGGVYVDRYQANRRAYHFDPSLFERIDVLKGTQGLLYGVASPGGIVNYVSKVPRFDEPVYRLEGTLGSFETLRGTLDATGPLNASRTVAYRLVVTGQSRNQTVHGRSDDESFDDRFILQPSLTWRTPTGGEMRLRYEFSTSDAVFDTGIKRLDDGRILFNTSFVGPESFYDRDFHMGRAELVQPLGGDWRLLLGGGLIRGDNRWLIDAAGWSGPLDGRDIPRATQLSLEDHEQEELRAELSGQFSTSPGVEHHLTVGASYLRTQTAADRATASTDETIDPLNPRFGPAPRIPDPEPIFTFGSDPELGVYLQDYLSVGDRLHAFGGLRYTHFREGFVGLGSSAGREGFGEDRVLDWSAGAIWNASPRVNPFLSYATSTESQRGLLTGGGLVPSQDGEQVEAGVKSEWLGGGLATTASFFQIRQTNRAEADPENQGFSLMVGDQRTRGFELEAAGELSDRVSLLAGYSYLDAEFTESLNPAVQGSTPFSVPEHKVSLFGVYELAGALRGWSANLGFIHVGERFGDNANTFELPTYERVDLGLAYRMGAVDVGVTVENLLDERYVAGSTLNAHQLAQGAPRVVQVRGGYAF